MNLINRLRYRFDEAYRIEIGMGLSPLRNNREIKALIRFCKNELKDVKQMKLNPERKKVYSKTVADYKKTGHIDLNYVEEHAGWYWS